MTLSFKRIIAIAMTLTLTFQCISSNFANNTITAQAATTAVSSAKARGRLKELAGKLGLTAYYMREDASPAISPQRFTVNGKACGHATSGDCSNCSNANIITKSECKCKNKNNCQCGWFKSKFGYLVPNVNNLPAHYKVPNEKVYFSDGSYRLARICELGYATGYCCYGFANFVAWYIAKEDVNSKVVPLRVGTPGMPFTSTYLKGVGVQIGDIIRTKTKGKNDVHSFIFLGYKDANNINVLDCNYVNREPTDIAKIKIHSIKLSSNVEMAITRAALSK